MLTPQEVADKLRIAKNTVYELVKRGELTPIKVGNKFRFDSSHIDAYQNGRSKSDSVNKIESLVLAGQDIVIDILAQKWREKIKGFSIYRNHASSYAGLHELYTCEAQAASIHLWHGATNTYNLPYLPFLLPGIPVVCINLMVRQVGFYLAKGNPLRIHSWEDFGRKDIRVINREPGSGMRVLLDEKLKQLGISSSDILGYENEVQNHLMVASSVAQGQADLGLGNEKTALQVPDIDFQFLQNENYDLIIRASDYQKPHFQTLANIIRSAEFKSDLSSLGYDCRSTGSITII